MSSSQTVKGVCSIIGAILTHSVRINIYYLQSY